MLFLILVLSDDEVKGISSARHNDYNDIRSSLSSKSSLTDLKKGNASILSSSSKLKAKPSLKSKNPYKDLVTGFFKKEANSILNSLDHIIGD